LFEVHHVGAEIRKKDAGSVVLDGTLLPYGLIPEGTSDVLAQMVDQPGSDELPHQRTALVTVS